MPDSPLEEVPDEFLEPGHLPPPPTVARGPERHIDMDDDVIDAEERQDIQAHNPITRGHATSEIERDSSELSGGRFR